jgi:hypothetical protein
MLDQAWVGRWGVREVFCASAIRASVGSGGLGTVVQESNVLKPIVQKNGTVGRDLTVEVPPSHVGFISVDVLAEEMSTERNILVSTLRLAKVA